MWKPISLALFASIPILPLACSSTDKGDSNAGGSSGASTAGSAGKNEAGAGNAGHAGSAGTHNGGASGNESSGAAGELEAGAAGMAELGSGGSETAGAGTGGKAGAGGMSGAGGKGGSGGSSGLGGVAGTAGGGGASGAAAGGTSGAAAGGTSGGGVGGMSGSGGSSVGGSAGHGGATNPGCGDSGQACCASNTCNSADLACLLGASCSCAKSIFGSYIIRADGVAIQQTSTTTQTPVLDANTALPLTGIVSGFDGGTLGGGFGCAARDDGTVWCWRTTANGNSSGNLGNGVTDTNGATFRATQVLTAVNTPLSNVKSLDSTSSCALTNDGKIYCWGNLTWLLNNGTSLISPYAQPITKDGQTALTGVQGFSVGLQIACAVVLNGSTNEVWCWGYNGQKNLGTGDTTSRKYPTKILGLTNPSQVIATWPFNNQNWRGSVCALDGGNVLCWGPNDLGEGGIAATTNPITVPTLVKLQDGVTALSGVTRLYPGNLRVCALHTGNTVWCWGSGYQNYADNIGLTNVVELGQAGGIGVVASSFAMTYLTSDGLFHSNTTTISPKCGSLQ